MRKKSDIIIPPSPNMEEEKSIRSEGYTPICGIDEAGRGPLAGPVVAAAVILPEKYDLDGLNDSKKLTAKKREKLYQALIEDDSVLKSIASASVEEIDRLNILQATHLAMSRAAKGLPQPVGYCLIDGLPVPNFPLPSKSLVKGDARSLSIAAASILAKVTRDHYMQKLALEFPNYGFDRNAGYGTKEHISAIHLYGITVHHRRSFAPVAQMELPLGL